MICGIETEEIKLEYIESEIDHPILWESHCHAKYEMIAVASGDITVMLEGQSYRLKENQTIIIPPLFYHSITANGGGCYRRITAQFGAEAIPSALRDKFSTRPTDTVIDSAHIEKLKDICQKEEPSFYSPLLQSLMIEIFYDALQKKEKQTRIETDEFLQKTFQYIDKHLQKKISLDDLAQCTSRSKSSFCHLFEAKMNISPKQYILQKKLALASKLINEGVPRTTAALHVGYENYSSFFRLYIKHVGKMPKSNKH